MNTNSLESLLKNVQSTVNNLSLLNNLNGTNNLNYAAIFRAMKDSLEKNSEKNNSNDEITELETQYEKEMRQFQNEMMIYDMYHDAYITNGFFKNYSKTKQRQQKYAAWGNIFSMQAERFQAQTQIAIQNTLRQQSVLNSLNSKS